MDWTLLNVRVDTSEEEIEKSLDKVDKDDVKAELTVKETSEEDERMPVRMW